ncbi:hypothetical protein VQ056_30230 [Paenibacillus sp. JTLBN-2024]
MMIHMTYRSGEYKVKGYLSLPYGYKIEPETLEAHVRKIYGGKRLPMTVIANNAKRERLDIHERKWPVLVYCRGGIGRVGQVKTEWLERFSQSGFIVFAPVYRGRKAGRDGTNSAAPTWRTFPRRAGSLPGFRSSIRNG